MGTRCTRSSCATSSPLPAIRRHAARLHPLLAYRFGKTVIASAVDNQESRARAQRASLELFACGCGTTGLQRIHRRLVVLSFRLNRCCRCGAVFLAHRLRSRDYPPV